MEKSGLTDKDGGVVPLHGVEIAGELCGGFARVQVRQRYRNHERRPIEAVYTFPLPSDATLTGFVMTADGRRIAGVVKEREAAFAAYDDAVTAGHGAALLEQERPNVFTASVGNLMPGEETVIEIAYVQRLTADEGALRWMIPTLVAPRYVPGVPAGDRTAGGVADPTDRVPDADRVTPPIGAVAYGLALDLRIDVGSAIEVSSPSHAIQTRRDGRVTRVSFAQEEVALDRDVVLAIAGTAEGPLTGAYFHRPAGGEGFLAVSVVPDLAQHARAQRQEVVFLIDVSGSMNGTSLPEAQAALRLCLRHLREGDRFNIIAFESRFTEFRAEPVPFTQRTLEEADAWVRALAAGGGTEMLAPLLAAVRQVRGGVVVLLTDGQVANEDEIAREVLAAASGCRIYSFGIGTSVSDALLLALSRQTGGAVEQIHPGERIDDKVVAQFARATLPRVTDVTVKIDGLEVTELAPAEPPPLVDGQPWTLVGKLAPGRLNGTVEIRGKMGQDAFYQAIAVDALAEGDQPLLPYLWATERVRDLEGAMVAGRRAERMKERIVDLGVTYGIATRYTAFLVVEERSGARRTHQQAETRVIPVHAPAGWTLARPRPDMTKTGGIHFGGVSMGMPAPAPMMPAAAAPPMRRMRAESAKQEESSAPSGDPVLELLARQLASGLWPGNDEAARVKAAAAALATLAASGVRTTHTKYGAQVKKAIEALLEALPRLPADLATLALAAAWLVADGRRTRDDLRRLAAAHPTLAAVLDDDAQVRALVTHRA